MTLSTSASQAFVGKTPISRSTSCARARLRTQVRICNTYNLCQILTALVGRVWRFTHFYRVTLLLKKWFTCHHFVREWQASIYCHFVKNCFSYLLTLAPSVNLSVDTFSDKRGRLFNVNHLIIFAFSYIKNIDSFFLSRSLPPNTEGSAEPSEAIGASLRTQVRIS